MKIYRLLVASLLVPLIGFGGCSESHYSSTELGAASGAVVGGGLGAIVGNQVGSTGGGIAVGAASGALVGGYVGNTADTIEDKEREQREILKRQQIEIDRQRREIEDLKRQKYYNDELQDYRRRNSASGSETSSSLPSDSRVAGLRRSVDSIESSSVQSSAVQSSARY